MLCNRLRGFQTGIAGLADNLFDTLDAIVVSVNRLIDWLVDYLSSYGFTSYHADYNLWSRDMTLVVRPILSP